MSVRPVYFAAGNDGRRIYELSEANEDGRVVVVGYEVCDAGGQRLGIYRNKPMAAVAARRPDASKNNNFMVSNDIALERRLALLEWLPREGGPDGGDTPPPPGTL